ncbi:hypothetical protein B0H12DRAFT_136625 [Mycena haematopus]|nr:hypothetical protein B0H12DRAFT_136625 [Mycena haematopus]
MASPSSPFRPSPSSSCSSTLIMTPAPGPVPLLHRGPKAKGPLQPHISNLPRRRRGPTGAIPMLRISMPPCASPSTSRNSSSPDSTATSYAASPIQLPTLPLLPFPISAPQTRIPQRQTHIAYGMMLDNNTDTEPVGPPHGNLPRRRTAKVVAAGRRRRQNLQELGRDSGVFVAFDGEDSQKQFGAVVRINMKAAALGADGDGELEEDLTPLLRLFVPGARDDGVPCLEPVQLRAACAFVCGHREGGRRVLITAPRELAVNAFSVALGVSCARSDSTVSAGEYGMEYEGGDVDAERMHRVLIRWHDLPSEVRGEEEGEGEGEGLRDEWRGLLSRDGIDYLATALASFPPSTSL